MPDTKTAKRYEHEGRFLLTTTSIKALNDLEICPAKLKAIFVDGYERESSSDMEKGNFFETLCIGGGYDGKRVDTLPLTSGNKKSVDQLRIEAQAYNFLQHQIVYKIVVARRQIRFMQVLDKHFALSTYVDIIGSMLYNEVQGTDDIMDLKLTKDINNTFGDYAWGMPELMDHSQATLCSYLYEKKHGVKPRFFYLVYDYKPHTDHKYIHKKISDTEYYELNARVELAMERFEMLKKNKWPYLPTYQNCHNCPVRATCPMTQQTKPIESI